MKFLVAYNGSAASRKALRLAGEFAGAMNAVVYVMTSMEGGTAETADDIQKAQEYLDEAVAFLKEAGVACEASELVRGLAPGEDLVRFAKENQIDHVFIGIEKRSRVGKFLMGSTAQYIILKAPCPVTSVRP